MFHRSIMETLFLTEFTVGSSFRGPSESTVSAPTGRAFAGHGRIWGVATVRIAIRNVVEKRDVVRRERALAL
jgi:hypothetical protein